MTCDELCERHLAARRCLAACTSDSQTVDDLSQTVLMKCLRVELEQGAAPSIPYVMAVARRELCSWHRRERSLTRRAEVHERCQCVNRETDADPLRQLERNELKIALEKALRSLASVDADVIRQHAFDGLSFRQISSCMALNPHTVKTRYRRALRTLRLQLASHQ